MIIARETRKVSQHSAEVGIPQVRRSQEPSGEDLQAEVGCMRGDACAAVQERKKGGTREVLPQTTTTLVVLQASTVHTVVESRRREDRTAFSERQWRTEDSREAHKVVSRCAQEAYSRGQPAGGGSRGACSTAQMSADVRLHSEGCRESIRQAMVDET